jgi:hypothetical protein
MIKAFLPAMIASGKGAADRQRRLDRLVGERRAEPLRLRRLEGGGDRPHALGRGRLRQA